MTSIVATTYSQSDLAVTARLRAEHRAGAEVRRTWEAPAVPEVVLVKVPDFGFSIARLCRFVSVPDPDAPDGNRIVPVYEMVTEELPLEEALGRLEDEKLP